MFASVSLSSGVSWFVVLLFLAVTWVCLQFLIVEFPDHTHDIKCASFVFYFSL